MADDVLSRPGGWPQVPVCLPIAGFGAAAAIVAIGLRALGLVAPAPAVDAPASDLVLPIVATALFIFLIGALFPTPATSRPLAFMRHVFDGFFGGGLHTLRYGALGLFKAALIYAVGVSGVFHQGAWAAAVAYLLVAVVGGGAEALALPAALCGAGQLLRRGKVVLTLAFCSTAGAVLISMLPYFAQTHGAVVFGLTISLAGGMVSALLVMLPTRWVSQLAGDIRRAAALLEGPPSAS